MFFLVWKKEHSIGRCCSSSQNFHVKFCFVEYVSNLYIWWKLYYYSIVFVLYEMIKWWFAISHWLFWLSISLFISFSGWWILWSHWNRCLCSGRICRLESFWRFAHRKYSKSRLPSCGIEFILYILYLIWLDLKLTPNLCYHFAFLYRMIVYFPSSIGLTVIIIVIKNRENVPFCTITILQIAI